MGEIMVAAYKNGKLDPSSMIGRGTIIEYIVMEAMKDCTKEKFNFKYDLYSKKLGEVNVKSSKRQMIKNSDCWNFMIKPNEYKPDFYVCVALDNYYSKILHVWEIPSKSNIVGIQRITVINSERGLKKVNEYEVDPTEYDFLLQNIDVTKYPEFCNLNKDKLVFSYPEPEEIKPPIKRYFDRETGEITTEKCKDSLELNMRKHCYPLYDHRGFYHGYIQDYKFVDIREEQFNRFIEESMNKNHGAKKVIGCRHIERGSIRKCIDCGRKPHMSDFCKERLLEHRQVGHMTDQYFYEEIYQ